MLNTGETTMSTKQKTVDNGRPANFKDAGYRIARNSDDARNTALWVYDQCPDFIDNPPEEIIAQLIDGFAMRFHENRGDRFYQRADSVMVECKPDTVGATVMNVHVAFGYTGQQFGKLKNEDPALHAIIKTVRDDFSGYRFDCMASLKNRIRKIINGGKTRERGANADYVDALRKAFDTFDTRALNAKNRGDSTADQIKFRVARDAFWVAYTGEKFKA
jgi:hypothetical protein